MNSEYLVVQCHGFGVYPSETGLGGQLHILDLASHHCGLSARSGGHQHLLRAYSRGVTNLAVFF